MNIVFLDARTIGSLPVLEKLKTLGQVTLYESTAYEQVYERVREADVIITNKVLVDKPILERLVHLKLICVAATGTNNVDVAFAQSKGISVRNVKGYSTHSVAQQTFALLMALLNQTKYYDEYVKRGEYSKESIFTHIDRPYWELFGKTWGIIGLGEIGRQVANIAEAFGLKVVYFSASGQSYDVPYERVSIEYLLQISDVVSVHSPLTPQTKNLISYTEIARMKPSALLLNVSRGGIVNEADLAKALNEKLIAGAAVDVFEQEPIATNHPYLTLQNPDTLVLSPHIAWASIEARTRLMERVIENILETVS